MNRTVLEDETDERPLDPAVERVRRKLVRFVAINLGLLFLALMAVALAIVYKTRTEDEAGQTASINERQLAMPGEELSGEILLPAGTTILSHGLSGTRLTLHCALADGNSAIFIYDVVAGRLVGRFDVKSN